MLSIGQCYLDFVNKILKEGKETYKDSDHHLKESLGNYYYIDDPLDLKFRAKYQHMTPELMLEEIKSGKFDIPSCPIKGDALYEYVKSFEIRDDQGFVYTYPNRILEHFGVDQFETMKQRILTATGSNRAVVFRSNDIFGAFYSNMFFTTYIGIKMKEEVNKEIMGEKLNFGGLHYHSTSGHIYNNDMRAAKRLISANKQLFR